MKDSSRKTAVLLFIARFIRLLVSVATLPLSAHFFGIGTDREVWILSLNFTVVLNLALWGPLNETFRTKFIFIREEEGEAMALKRTAGLLLFTILVLAGLAALLSFFSLPLARLIAPGYSADTLNSLSLLLQCMLWSVVISQATQLLSSLLNAYHSFLVPEVCGFISALINFFIIWLLSYRIGIYSFVLANYASLLLLLIALLLQLQKLNIPLFHIRPQLSWSMISPFILFSLPFFLPYVMGQINSLTEKSIASTMEAGAVAVIDYAKRMSDMIQTVLTSILTTMMVPVLSSKFSAGNMVAAGEESRKYSGFVFITLAFFIPLLVVSAGAITEILYHRGNIDTEALQQITTLTRCYAIGLPAIFGYLVLGLTLLSAQKSREYAFYGMIAQLLMIALNFLLYRKLGIYTFVFSLTLSHLCASVFLFLKIPFSKTVTGKDLLRHGLFIATLTLTVFLADHYFYSPGNAYVHVLYNSFLIFILGLLYSFLFRLPERQFIRQILVKHLKR